MSRVLIPLPERGFDPTEAAVPWKVLSDRGHEIIFATPGGAKRDSMDALHHGFTVRDRNLLTARWPGDAHRWSVEFDELLRA